MPDSISIIIPAKDEATNLAKLLPRLVEQFPTAEIIVVDDASTDNTAAICEQFGVRRIVHAHNLGNGAAIKSGVRAATREIAILMDGDGQHDPADIPKLLEKLSAYDMVIGARSGRGHSSFARRLANASYNRIAHWITGHQILDLTSGFRAIRVKQFRRYLYLLPNGFSYPTTCTMAFLRSGFPVSFVPVTVTPNKGSSHIRPINDGLRFLIIIIRIGTLYSPLKVFLPTSLIFFLLGLSHYFYTFLAHGRFTNMSALLLVSAVIVFLIGLVSEQITSLMYQRSQDD